MTSDRCGHAGCANPVRARGLCPTHWWQMKKHGETWDAGTRWKRLTDAEVDGALLLLARGATSDEVAEAVGLPSGKTLTHHLRRAAKEGLRDALSARVRSPHGNASRYARGCRCGDCVRAHAEKARSDEVASDGVLRRRMVREAVTEPEIRQHFRASAERLGYQWTGPEIETALATNPDGTWLRSAYEVARLLGRSIDGVKYIRAKREDPRVSGML